MKKIKVIMSKNKDRFRVEADGKNVSNVKGVEIRYNSGSKPEVVLTLEAEEVEAQALEPKIIKEEK